MHVQFPAWKVRGQKWKGEKKGGHERVGRMKGYEVIEGEKEHGRGLQWMKQGMERMEGKRREEGKKKRVRQNTASGILFNHQRGKWHISGRVVISYHKVGVDDSIKNDWIPFRWSTCRVLMWNWTLINKISFTCAFPAMTTKNVCHEKGQ